MDLRPILSRYLRPELPGSRDISRAYSGEAFDLS